ncbi:hypothetical protein [Shimia sp. Alg240-R146]|uniref:hypothetical protein n=1 Tax=Shimia sp. Alg240-R146 TaxID=2993449 RepID=UPI0022E5338B|nr:hypothetical protein [Shimia sp. Alg240-R146]
MSRPRNPGARRVGWLADLPAAERMAVRCLRAIGRDAASDTQLTADLALALGPARGHSTKAVLNELMQVAQYYGRRPLCRHADTCDCLDADEAVFAALVGYALNSAQEDATLMASLLVRPDMAQCFAGLATEFGLAMDAMTRTAAPFVPQTHRAQMVVH